MGVWHTSVWHEIIPRHSEGGSLHYSASFKFLTFAWRPHASIISAKSETTTHLRKEYDSSICKTNKERNERHEMHGKKECWDGGRKKQA